MVNEAIAPFGTGTRVEKTFILSFNAGSKRFKDLCRSMATGMIDSPAARPTAKLYMWHINQRLS